MAARHFALTLILDKSSFNTFEEILSSMRRRVVW